MGVQDTRRRSIMFFGKSGFKLCRIGGIVIYIDWSWAFIFLLLSASLALGVFPRWHHNWGTLEIWLVSIAAALLFFASVVAHEMAHSLVAKAQGVPVKRIVLFLFGGVSNIEREPRSARDEFVMAIVGPLTSVILGLLFGWWGSRSLAGAYGSPMQALSRLGPLSTLLLWLGPINLLVGLFNLIPAFPLDGGRIFRSIVWASTHNLKTATRVASITGEVIAWLLIAAGVAMVFGLWIPFLGTGLVGGLWIAFIGWFLKEAASTSRLQFAVHDLLEDVPVSTLMHESNSGVQEDLSVDALVHEHILRTEELSYPVLSGIRLVGLVCLDDVRKLPREAWPTTPVSQIMTPVEKLTVVSPEENAAAAFESLVKRDVRQLPVVEGNQMVGVLRRRDVVRWLQLHSELAG